MMAYESNPENNRQPFSALLWEEWKIFWKQEWLKENRNDWRMKTGMIEGKQQANAEREDVGWTDKVVGPGWAWD